MRIASIEFNCLFVVGHGAINISSRLEGTPSPPVGSSKIWRSFDCIIVIGYRTIELAEIKVDSRTVDVGHSVLRPARNGFAVIGDCALVVANKKVRVSAI